ncbi:hypothetical protein J7J13_04000 [bacterium]|nr:hypothetical protein [bacterium]
MVWKVVSLLFFGLLFANGACAQNWVLNTNDPSFIITKEYNENGSKPIVFGKLVDAPNECGCNQSEPNRTMEFDISIFSHLAGSSFDVNKIYVDGIATGELALGRWLESFYDNEGIYAVVPLYNGISGGDLSYYKYGGKLKACFGKDPMYTTAYGCGTSNIVLWYDGSVNTTYHSTPSGGTADTSTIPGSLEVCDTGQIIAAVSGPGAETLATDEEDPGKPDFIVKRVELSNYNPSKNDEIKVRAKLKNIGENDISSDDKIETRFYLSMGYKEDLHSEWIRIGREYTKGSNLDPGETHWEEESLRLWEYNQIQPGQVYNIVACVDRTKDQNNEDGDYEEEHKSNNCSTEAVFTVTNPPPPPAPPPPPQTTSPDGKFAWSYSGPISGMVCAQIAEPADSDTWNDNYFCGNENYGIQWSCCGPISNMKNTQIHESADPDTWDDNYLAVPNDSLINFSWSSAGPIAGLNCVQWIEPADPDTWDDNYLCYTINVPPPPPPAEYNFSITNLTFSVKDRVKLWPGEAFSVSTTAYNSGDNPPSNVHVGYYLDDVLIGTDTISASDFSHGSYRSEALENAIAPSEPGDHTARVCVDCNNQIQETDESDNCQSITIKVEKHLSPAALMLLFSD